VDADGGAESNDGLRVTEMGSALLFEDREISGDALYERPVLPSVSFSSSTSISIRYVEGRLMLNPARRVPTEFDPGDRAMVIFSEDAVGGSDDEKRFGADGESGRSRCPRARNHPTVMVLLGHRVIFEVLYSVIE